MRFLLHLLSVYRIPLVDVILHLVARIPSVYLLSLRPLPVHRIASVDIVLRLVARVVLIFRIHRQIYDYPTWGGIKR